MMRRHERRLRGALPVLALLVLAGCSTGGSGSVATAGGPVAAAGPAAASGAGPQPAGDEQAQARRFAACMREHGIDLPDPEPGGGSGFSAGARLDGTIDTSRMAEAHQACQRHAPGLSGGGPKKLDAEQLAQQRRFAACMREHGVEGFPDPSPDGDALVIIGEGGVDPKDPTFKAAANACGKPGPATEPAKPGDPG